MPKPQMTAQMARFAGEDAANKRMRSENRSAWNEADLAFASVVSSWHALDIPVEDGGLKGVDINEVKTTFPDLFDALGARKPIKSLHKQFCLK